MSRGFICTLVGIAMTVFSWYGPWNWPAWPALTAVRYVVGTDFAERPFAERAAIIVLLIAINTAFWSAVCWAVWWTVQRLIARRRELPL